MKNTQILEMLNNGEIEKLKRLLSDEIYNESLNNGNKKQRYAAMKCFFKYIKDDRKALSMPCENVKVNGEFYNSFVSNYCFALTKESIGEIEPFNENANEKYFDVERFVNFSAVNSTEKVDLNSVIAEAKSKGYKFKKSELSRDFSCVFKYKDAYFNVALLDKAFSIINDGEEAEVYYTNKSAILLIKTSLGIAGILPFKPTENVEEIKTIISR